MKILFLCRLFYPHIGGVETHVMELSKQLIKLGHEVTVITEAQDEKSLSFELKNNIAIHRIFVGKENTWKKYHIWAQLLRKQHLLKKADIIHCHDVFFWYLPFRFLFPNKLVYTTFHGYESYPVSKKAIVVRKLSEKLSKGNICIGDFMQKCYKTKPSIVLYGGVHMPKIQTNKQYTKAHSAVFVGRLDEQTGILTYVRAITLLKQVFSDFTLLVLGDGAYRYQIEKTVIVKGFVSYPQKYFPQYHFAFVSRYLSILEAMAYKKLIFAVYDNPIKEDYLKMTPFAKWITIVNNEAELKKKIMYFQNHPEEEKELVDHAYSWVKGQTWEHLTNEYLRLWKR